MPIDWLLNWEIFGDPLLGHDPLFGNHCSKKKYRLLLLPYILTSTFYKVQLLNRKCLTIGHTLPREYQSVKQRGMLMTTTAQNPPSLHLLATTKIYMFNHLTTYCNRTCLWKIHDLKTSSLALLWKILIGVFSTHTGSLASYNEQETQWIRIGPGPQDLPPQALPLACYKIKKGGD